MRGIIIQNTEPALNLAIEDILFDGDFCGHRDTESATQDAGLFLLWHNAPSIIVGRHQNTAQEVNNSLVQQYNVPVIRRMTGGGAVYHDLGNVNFSFIVPAHSVPHADKGMNFHYFMQPIVEALQGLGVPAEQSSRNDLVCHNRKFSGSAQLRRRGLILHHGTLLVSLDLDMLGAVLTGAPDKYTSKGIESVRSRVMNLQDVLAPSVTMEHIKAALLARCATSLVSLEDTTTPFADVLPRARALAERKYRAWQWNYGASPPFTEKRRERFAWGLVECHMAVLKGRIEYVKIFGDFFAQEDVETLERMLVHVAYTPEAVKEALAQCPFDVYFNGCDEERMRQFFCCF